VQLLCVGVASTLRRVCVCVCSLSLNPTNPQIFCSGSIDSAVKVWDIRAKNPCTHTFTGHESDVNAVDFFPDGNAVGTGACRVAARCAGCSGRLV
jgi:guanine nucleotide-binding protein G(I)/G(S)/G(T) subunit beta-1